jgi:hypothetical protein
MQQCKECNAEISKEQVSESLTRLSCHVPRRGHTNTFDWAQNHGPLCGDCMTKWLQRYWGFGQAEPFYESRKKQNRKKRKPGGQNLN